jgi:hypothetical protein
MSTSPTFVATFLDGEVTPSFEELKALPIRELAAPSGCHMFLWTSGPYYARSLELIEAWRFKTAHGRLTPTQIDTQARMRAAGATVGIAVEIDAALELLERWGLLRPNVASQLAEAL